MAEGEASRGYVAPGRRLVIVGGGYIGLELAAVAAKRGVEVTVLEQAPRVMARGVGPIVSAFYERLHREEGVTIATGTAVTGFEGNGRLEQVICDGLRLAADLVVVGVGAIPHSELAREAGLARDHRLRLDCQCRPQGSAPHANGAFGTPAHPPAHP